MVKLYHSGLRNKKNYTVEVGPDEFQQINISETGHFNVESDAHAKIIKDAFNRDGNKVVFEETEEGFAVAAKKDDVKENNVLKIAELEIALEKAREELKTLPSAEEIEKLRTDASNAATLRADLEKVNTTLQNEKSSHASTKEDLAKSKNVVKDLEKSLKKAQEDLAKANSEIEKLKAQPPKTKTGDSAGPEQVKESK